MCSSTQLGLRVAFSSEVLKQKQMRCEVMAERKYTHGLVLDVVNSVTVISIGTMEIWDGADLSLIRDAILQLVTEDDIDSVGIDMSHVHHVPSGFFGMLYDWHERGLTVQLLNPRERVQQMLWFRKFFLDDGDQIFHLYRGEGINEELSEDLWKPSNRIEALNLRPISTWN